MKAAILPKGFLMIRLCKITLLTFIFFNFSVFGGDLSNLKGKWVGTTQLGEVDHVAFLQIEDDSSGYFTQTILSSGIKSKYRFTINDLTVHDGFYELLLHRKNKANKEKLVFITNGYEIKGMNISIIKEQTVLYYNVNLSRYKPAQKKE
jgi:hypothetical protein